IPVNTFHYDIAIAVPHGIPDIGLVNSWLFEVFETALCGITLCLGMRIGHGGGDERINIMGKVVPSIRRTDQPAHIRVILCKWPQLETFGYPARFLIDLLVINFVIYVGGRHAIPYVRNA